jgi:hypothetical protein
MAYVTCDGGRATTLAQHHDRTAEAASGEARTVRSRTRRADLDEPIDLRQ